METCFCKVSFTGHSTGHGRQLTTPPQPTFLLPERPSQMTPTVAARPLPPWKGSASHGAGQSLSLEAKSGRASPTLDLTS